MKRIFTLLLIIAASAGFTKAQGLIINEIDYDQPSVDSAEFIELYNSSANAILLSDYTVLLFNGNATSNVVYDSFPLPATVLNPGGYFVICGSGGNVPNCNMPLPGKFANIIQNGPPDAVAIRENQTSNITDVISYEGSCIAPYVSGNGLPLAQSDTAQADSIAGRHLGISRFPDGADTNDDSTDFNRVCITPGAANLNTSNNCVTGLSTPKSTLTIDVFPNPSKGIININYKAANGKAVNVRVSDILGNELKNVTLKANSTSGQIDLSDFHNGIYLVKVAAGSMQTVKRIVLNK